MKNLSSLLRNASAVPDDSLEFHEHVRSMSVELSEILEVEVVQRKFGDYSVCDTLWLMVDAHGGPVSKDADSAAKRIDVAISSVAPAWTVFVYERTGERSWAELDLQSRQRGVSVELWNHLRAVVGGSGLAFLDASDLAKAVEGAHTMLDGVQATVREVLFCEVC